MSMNRFPFRLEKAARADHDVEDAIVQVGGGAQSVLQELEAGDSVGSKAAWAEAAWVVLTDAPSAREWHTSCGRDQMPKLGRILKPFKAAHVP